LEADAEVSDVERILEASRYVAAAYGILWVAIVIYVVSLGARVSRLHKEIALLADVLERRKEK